jgi:hypothetical protein
VPEIVLGSHVEVRTFEATIMKPVTCCVFDAQADFIVLGAHDVMVYIDPY